MVFHLLRLVSTLGAFKPLMKLAAPCERSSSPIVKETDPLRNDDELGSCLN